MVPGRSRPLLLLYLCAGMLVPAAGFAAESTSDHPISAESLRRALQLEAQANANPLAISTYKLNYALPIAYDTHLPNLQDYRAAGNRSPQHNEIKYQISLKVNLANHLFHNNGDLYLGYTQFSLWQAYNSRDSAPFRETNYEPELFMSFTNHQRFFGFDNTINRIGIIHQSNGRGGENESDQNSVSRSWNRIYAEAILQRGHWTLSLMPWWRIPEARHNDNNRNIEKYLGWGKVGVLYTTNNGQEVSLETKGNPFTGRLGTELDYTFPLNGRLRGMVQYYHGYGESMIDYDHRVNRFGLGLSFNPYLAGITHAPTQGAIGTVSPDTLATPDASRPDENTDNPELNRIRAARRYFDTQAHNNPLSLSTYHRNYVLPVAYNSNSVNNNDFAVVSPNSHPNHNEVKFQLSIKARLWHNLFSKYDNGDLYFGYTQQSWWQAYNSKASSPFRETNYEPELFAEFTNHSEFLGFTNVLNRVGFEHQSNGRADPISRSWNRLYAEGIFVRGPIQLDLKPWWRIPESKDTDDNHDIEDYMGYGQASVVYNTHGNEFSYTVIGNPFKGNFGHKFEYSFPLWDKIHGFLQYYHGYGESMIDYNRSVNRIGIGVDFNNVALGQP